MGIWAGLIAAVFLYAGARWMLPTLITGTTTGETLVLNILPIALAACVVGVVIKVLK